MIKEIQLICEQASKQELLHEQPNSYFHLEFRKNCKPKKL